MATILIGADRRQSAARHRPGTSSGLLKIFDTVLATALLFIFAGGPCSGESTEASPGARPQVAAPPESLKLDPFYKKFLSSEGLPIISSDKVPDAALVRADYLINHMLAGLVIGAEEGVTEIPEYSHMKPKAFWDERSRGFGGRIVSCGEENLLSYPVDRYDDESIFVHEFAHCIHGLGLRRIDKSFNDKLRQTYDKALSKGLWKNTYAASNPGEYWAEGVQSWFDANRQNNYNHNHVNTRKELEAYDPDLAQLIAETFRRTDDTDWRCKPLAQQPQVTSPPESLSCDPFYTKYVRVRGLPVLGSASVSDAALLDANYLIRKMFAYRHDILKAIIEADIRFVVIGVKEKVTDLPEYNDLKPGRRWNRLRRGPDYSPELPVISCSEENLLNHPGDRRSAESLLIRQFARALHRITGLRDVDEKSESKPKQQYELGLTRMDRRFDDKLKGLFENAAQKGLWKETLAAKNHNEYWAEGVQSWFDANRENGRDHNHVNTRRELEAYDPDLAALIAEVFRHTERVDWRYQPPDLRK